MNVFVASSPLRQDFAGHPDTLSLCSSYRDCSPCSQLLALPPQQKIPLARDIFVAPSPLRQDFAGHSRGPAVKKLPGGQF
jgi:hypothetical protein